MEHLYLFGDHERGRYGKAGEEGVEAGGGDWEGGEAVPVRQRALSGLQAQRRKMLTFGHEICAAAFSCGTLNLCQAWGVCTCAPIID